MSEQPLEEHRALARLESRDDGVAPETKLRVFGRAIIGSLRRNRYADLLFEVVTRRYLTSPVLITTNGPFSEWAGRAPPPSASSPGELAQASGTLVDRLIHRSEIVQLDGESYRLKEAKEQAAKRSETSRGAKELVDGAAGGEFIEPAEGCDGGADQG